MPAKYRNVKLLAVAPTEPLLQACPGCASLLDVSGEEAFGQVHCPMCGTAMRTRTQFHHFTLQDVLGIGGMGTVYRALDVNLNRLVAFKVLRQELSANQGHIEKFEREASITASVNHPHVVKVFSCDSDHGLFYIAMELVDRGSLDDLMTLQGRVAEAQVLEVGIQIAQGLQAAFVRGLIHRDVKPGNILFADAHTAKIVDFGLALLLEEEAAARGEVWGTPYYVAPEKLNHEPEDFRSDIYSLGGTLFHAIAGRPPFEAESASLVALKHLKSRAVSLQAFAPDVSSATAYVINRMLHKDPNQRYQTHVELIDHLKYARTQLLETSGKMRPRARVVVEGAEQQSARGKIVLGAIVVMLLAAGLLFAFRDRWLKKEERPVVAATQPAGLDVAADPIFVKGRKELLEGDYATAAQTFHEAGGEFATEPPLQNWLQFHEGLAALLGGRLEDARGIFSNLQSAGMFSEKPDQLPLANFFVETSRLLADDKEVPARVTKNYSARTCEALSIFAFALKDWELAKFEEAGPLFHWFVESDPQPPYAWVGEYRPIAKKYAADCDAFAGLSAAVAAADTAEKRGAVLQSVQKVKDELQIRGKMLERVLVLELTLQRKSADVLPGAANFGPPATGAGVAPVTADSAAWDAARTRAAAFAADFHFLEAKQALEKTDAPGDRSNEKAMVTKKLDWLANFKATLSADINSAGFPRAITKRNGAVVSGGITKATESTLATKTPYGFVETPWRDVMPNSILAMSDFFQKQKPETERGDRLWLAGVFACERGMPKEGKALVVQAAQLNEHYKDDLPLFIDVAE